jgi:hypothetical protein
MKERKKGRKMKVENGYTSGFLVSGFTGIKIPLLRITC